MTTDMTEVLSRSRATLDPHARGILSQGRTVRSRNRDGEYAIVLTDNRAVVNTKASERIDGIADQAADWTIVVTDFTFKNVAESDPSLLFWAPVFDRASVRVGTICVNSDPCGTLETTEGRVHTQVLPFTSLREGDLFCEAEADGQGLALVFRATADADQAGRVTAVVASSGEERIFDLGPDYLAFKVI